MSDPNMHFDGQRWLRWDGSRWIDAGSGPPTGGKPRPPRSNWDKAVIGMAIAGGALALTLVGVVAVATAARQAVPAPTTTATATATASETTPPAPTQPQTPKPSPTTAQPQPADQETVLNAAVTDSIRSGNREVPRVASVNYNSLDRIVVVRWAINDNVTSGLVVLGAEEDVKNILRAIQESGVPWNEAIVSGTFPARAVNGQVNELEAIEATYSQATVSTIDWERVRDSNMPQLAEKWRQATWFN